MTHASVRFILWVGILLILKSDLHAQMEFVSLEWNDTLYAESLEFSPGEHVLVYSFIYQEYDFRKSPGAVWIRKSDKVEGKIQASELGCGTTWFLSGKVLPDSLDINQVMNMDGVRSTCVSVSKSQGYLGKLEEMINVPFVLPPRFLGHQAHQTDLHFAVDCAELAIAGKRKQGYNLQYLGPRGILKYLEKTSSFIPGTIIHFGHQVSVLYSDQGTIGQLDADDLLIHAYSLKVEIIRFGNTDLNKSIPVLYKWIPTYEEN